MASDNKMKSAEETYSGFLSWLKIGSIITAIVTILVIFLIST
ncbi:MAG: aa3-type cytochrome c oxidase subunit IV [Pseudomonadota bacterium]